MHLNFDRVLANLSHTLISPLYKNGARCSTTAKVCHNMIYRQCNKLREFSDALQLYPLVSDILLQTIFALHLQWINETEKSLYGVAKVLLP